MVYKADNEKVAKFKRAIINDSSRRFKENTLGDLYSDEKLGEMYKKWHYNILTDFLPGEEMQEMVDFLALLYIKRIDIDNFEPWLLYFAHKSTLFAKNIHSMSDLAKISFMEQKKEEEEIMEASQWLFSKKERSV